MTFLPLSKIKSYKGHEPSFYTPYSHTDLIADFVPPLGFIWKNPISLAPDSFFRIRRPSVQPDTTPTVTGNDQLYIASASLEDGQPVNLPPPISKGKLLTKAQASQAEKAAKADLKRRKQEALDSHWVAVGRAPTLLKRFMTSFLYKEAQSPGTSFKGSMHFLMQGNLVESPGSGGPPARTVYHPLSPFLQTWNSAMVILMVVQFLCVPVAIGFQEAVTILPYITGICAPLYAFDMWVACNTGFYNADSYLVLDRRAVWRRYVVSFEFLIDLLSVVPYYFIVDSWFLANSPADSEQATQLLAALLCVCLLNTVRIVKLVFWRPATYIGTAAKYVANKLHLHSSTASTAEILVAMCCYWYGAFLLYFFGLAEIDGCVSFCIVL